MKSSISSEGVKVPGQQGASTGVWTTTRVALSLPILWFSAFLGLLGSGARETCTGGAADAYAIGGLVLFLNILGMAFLVKGIRLSLLAVATFIPALAALYYTAFTIQFVSGVMNGMNACTIMLGEPFPLTDGSEVQFAWQWIGAALVFWVGLGIASRNSIALRARSE